MSLARLNYDDYALIASDGRRHEIIDGERYVCSAQNTKHQRVALNLAVALESFVRPQRLGRVYLAPLDVVLSANDVLQPDLVFISREREHVITHANVQGAPDLVIEILSPSTRKLDLTVKRQRYERFGVEEYWVVDPESETVDIYRRDATSPLLPGFSLDVRDVFAE